MSDRTETYCLNGIHRDINEFKDFQKSAGNEQRSIAEAILDWHQNDEFVFQTSGSTGIPKQINFTKDQIKSSISLSERAFDLTDRDVALLSLPMKYVAGKMMLYRALHLGMNVITIEPKMTIPKEKFDSRISFAAFIPSQIESLLTSREGRAWLESIRIVLVGGGHISSELEKELQDFSNSIYHTYGMTETLTHIAVRELSNGGISFFRPLPNVVLNVDKDKRLSIDAKHLGVKIVTNDLADMRRDSTFKILGRADNVINSGGLKIHPEELESIFKKYIQNELFVTGIPDDRLGERVALIIESNETIDPEWIQAAQSELSKNKWPKEIKYISVLPRTESGKVIRKNIDL